jgi:hypothetical protein
MNSVIDWAKASWTHLLWVIAGIIVLIDPAKIYEWGHRHEGWGDLIIVVFGILLAWASKLRQPSAAPPSPTNRGAQSRAA